MASITPLTTTSVAVRSLRTSDSSSVATASHTSVVVTLRRADDISAG